VSSPSSSLLLLFLLPSLSPIANPGSMATPDQVRKAQENEKKIAYAAALRQQMLENEEKKRQVGRWWWE